MARVRLQRHRKKTIIVISFYNIPMCTIVNSNKGVTTLVQDAMS